jgi:hypothetical protein
MVRKKRIMVVYTIMKYDEECRDAGIWVRKVPNLFDIDAKYGNVLSLQEVLYYIGALPVLNG